MALLDRWEMWKRIKTAPDEIEALKRRVAALEAKLGHKPGLECPFCGGVMRLQEIKPHPLYGEAGMKLGIWKCEDCGKTVDRERKP